MNQPSSRSSSLPIWTTLVFAGWLLSFLFSCQQPRQGSEQTEAATNDTTALMNNFLTGLWSVDSQNFLNNEGFYLQPDGRLSLVASEAQGEWRLMGRDTLYLNVHNWSPDPLEYFFILDSLDPQFMILRDTTGQTVYRKVPYGTNAEGIVLNGFMGTLDRQLNAKEYRFDLPSAKRIKLELKSAFAGISFRVFDGEHELTAAPVKSWDAILIRSGQYRAVVAIDDPRRLSEDRIEFDLKVYGY
ncbi:MAG: hypothetical protein KBA16_06725 [Bacteroidia bacterium]|jgi:hypothetical protein|nr:hypothetical protein [Bacteroidia bacterium]MBP7269562.1 hypothetical protein [Bacteroidia bacterium]MBP7437397.1 hypothetical protein [Bacteroidia bacterium]MBP7771153.1 hypothetical protein [Bacteroidia bacterium]